MVNTQDRKDINTALAKAIAYVNCQQQGKAEQHARELIKLLQLKHILKP